MPLPLLRQLVLSGFIATVDAMGTQTAIAAPICEQGGDYVLAPKDDQGSIYEGVTETFAMAHKDHFAQVQHDSYRTVEKDHVRVENRDHWAISDPDILAFLDANHRWQGLQAIGMVRAE